MYNYVKNKLYLLLFLIYNFDFRTCATLKKDKD